MFPASGQGRWVRQELIMQKLARLLVRAILAVVVFAVACPALAAISLAAMYSDHRLSLSQVLK
jgi:hypothetical protein